MAWTVRGGETLLFPSPNVCGDALQGEVRHLLENLAVQFLAATPPPEDSVAFLIDALQRVSGRPLPGSGPFGEQVSGGAVPPLLRALRESSRAAACERAEYELERAEADARIGELESKVVRQRQANQALLRRVQMLEVTLHGERHRRELASSAGGAVAGDGRPGVRGVAASPDPSVPRLPPGGLPGRPALEALLQRRATSLSARRILEAYLQNVELGHDPEGGGGAYRANAADQDDDAEGAPLTAIRTPATPSLGGGVGGGTLVAEDEATEVADAAALAAVTAAAGSTVAAAVTVGH